MICQSCGLEAPTKYVSFHQNIGALVMRFQRSITGNLCKACVHKHFWSMTTTTMFLGWWGMISLIATPIFLINNVCRYLFCLGMPAVPVDAARPELTEEALSRIEPHVDELIRRINDREKLETVVTDIADASGTTPGQVQLYVLELSRAQQRRRQR